MVPMIAAALRESHAVEIVHHHRDLPLRARYHDWDWSRRLGCFQTKLAISKFTSRWACA